MPKVKARKRCGGALGFAEINCRVFWPKFRRQCVQFRTAPVRTHRAYGSGSGRNPTFLAGNHAHTWIIPSHMSYLIRG